METLKRIDVSFAYSLLTLDDNNFSSLPRFMNDFREMFFSDANHSLVVFLNSVCSVLNIESIISETLSERYYEFEIRNDYLQFIMKYQSLLQELIEKDLFYVLFRIMSNESDYLYFLEFYDYLICNFDSKLQIMENLYHMCKSDVFEFSFDFQGVMKKEFEIFSVNQGVALVSNLTFDSSILDEDLEETNRGFGKNKVLKN